MTNVRDPSIITAIARPAKNSESECSSLKKISLGFVTAFSPHGDISNTPSWKKKKKKTVFQFQKKKSLKKGNRITWWIIPHQLIQNDSWMHEANDEMNIVPPWYYNEIA